MTNTDARALRATINNAADIYRLTSEDIMGPRRDCLAVAARASVIWWARREGYSLPFLSQFFRRDHTCILAAERRHAKQVEPLPFKSVRGQAAKNNCLA